MQKSIFITLSILCASPLFAQEQPTNMQPLFDNPFVNMTYPQVAGNYLVYAQRIKSSHQVVRLKRDNLYGESKNITASFTHEVVRNGIAFANGDIAYVSNRLGNISPWLSQGETETVLGSGIFQNLLLPNHIDTSANGKTWVFDSTLETTRTPRLSNQFIDERLDVQLLGQTWRMYHSKLWAFKSDYPQTKTGLNNRFQQPHLFSFQRGNNEVSMLGDGFDASLSQDGKSIVFVRETNGNFDLWSQNLDGTGSKQLTKNIFADIEPTLSPDGKRVAFVSNRDANGEVLNTNIYTLEIATGLITRITFGNNVTDGGPAWWDNNSIIFHSNRDPKAANTDTVDNWRLWTVALPK